MGTVNRSTALFAVCGLVLLAGCGQDEIRVYEVARAEAPPAREEAAAPRSERPQVPWTVPQGWQETTNTSGMRMASYGVGTPDGRSMDVSVVVLGADSGSVLDNVNRWRRELKLPPIEASDLDSVREPVRIGQEASTLYDMTSEEAVIQDEHRGRTLVAMLDAGGATVFFKAMGEARLVGEQKPNVIQWLNSVMTGPPREEPPPAASASPAAEAPSIQWQAPDHWKAGGDRPMRYATYQIPGGDAGQDADLSISFLSRDGGGVLNNFNRWRGQVGLPPLTESAFEEAAKRLETGNGREMIYLNMIGSSGADGSGNKTAILGAMLPGETRSWFFKLTGDDTVLKREEPAFIRFLESVSQ